MIGLKCDNGTQLTNIDINGVIQQIDCLFFQNGKGRYTRTCRLRNVYGSTLKYDTSSRGTDYNDT